MSIHKQSKMQFNDKLAFVYLFVAFLIFWSLVFKRFGHGTSKASNAPRDGESPSLLAGPRNKSRPGEDV